MPIHASVENYLNDMTNAPIFAQLFALMWGIIPRVLVPKFPMVLESQAIKFENTNFHTKMDFFCTFKFDGL